jgi:chromosome segregation ATPase
MKQMKSYPISIIFLPLFLAAGLFFGGATFAQNSSTRTINDTLNNFDDAFQDLKDERDALHREVEDLKTEQRALLDNAKKRIESIEDEKQKTAEAADIAQDQVKEVQQEKEEIMSDLENTQMQMTRYDEALAGRDAATESMRIENEDLKTALAQNERTLEKAAALIKRLEAEKESLEGEQATIREERKQILSGYGGEMGTIRKQRQELLAQLDDTRDRLKLAEEQVGRFNKKQEKVDKGHDVELAKARESSSLSEIAAKNMKEELKTVSKVYEEAQAKLKLAEDDLKFKEDKLAANEEKFSIAVKDLGIITDKFLALSKEDEDLKKELAVLKDGTEKSSEDAKKEIETLTSGNESLKKELAALTAEHAQSKAAAGAEIAALTQGNEGSKKEMNLLTEENKKAIESAKAEIQSLNDRVQTLSSNLNATDSLSKKQQAELLEMSAAMKAAEAKVGLLRDEKIELLKKIEALSMQLVDYNAAITKNVALEKENKLFKGSIDKTVKSFKEADAQSQEVSGRYEKEKQEWESLKKQYTESLVLIEEAKGLKAQNLNLMDSLKASEAKLKKVLDSFVNLQDENEEMREDSKTRVNPREYKATKQSSESLDKENAQLKQDVKKYTERIAELEEASKALVQEKGTQDQKLARMDSHLKQWDKEKQEWQETESKTKTVLKTKEDRLYDAKDGMRKTMEENTRLRAKVESFPRDLASLNAKAEKLEKENAFLHYNLGVIYTDKEYYEDAVKEFEKALEMKPDDAPSHYNLGIIYSQYLIDETKALQHFKKYLKTTPDDKDADMARRYVFTRETYGDGKEK